jgi:hypothetical protein
MNQLLKQQLNAILSNSKNDDIAAAIDIYYSSISEFCTRINEIKYKYIAKHDRSINQIFDQIFQNDPSLYYEYHNQIIGSGHVGWPRNDSAILLVTLPKSATVYISSKISNICFSPLVYITLEPWPGDLISSFVKTFKLYGGVVSTHLAPSEENIQFLISHGLEKMVVHIRDPRQAILSWSHYTERILCDANNRNRYLIESQYGPQYADLSLHDKIDFHIDNTLRGWSDWIEGWLHLKRKYSSEMDIMITSINELVLNETEYFSSVLTHFDAEFDKCDLTSLDGDNVHFRKGMLDEWEKIFTNSQKDRSNQFISKNISSILRVK